VFEYLWPNFPPQQGVIDQRTVLKWLLPFSRLSIKYITQSLINEQFRWEFQARLVKDW
jgi:hypothetical protein